MALGFVSEVHQAGGCIAGEAPPALIPLGVETNTPDKPRLVVVHGGGVDGSSRL